MRGNEDRIPSTRQCRRRVTTKETAASFVESFGTLANSSCIMMEWYNKMLDAGFKIGSNVTEYDSIE